MKLWFDQGGDGRDFAAVCDLPESLRALDPDGERGGEVWFRAYDTEVDAAFNQCSRLLLDSGYEFDCEIRIEFAEEPTGHDIVLHDYFAAHNKQEAERLLQIAADALYK